MLSWHERLSRNFPKGPRITTKHLGRCPGRHWSRLSPKHKSRRSHIALYVRGEVYGVTFSVFEVSSPHLPSMTVVKLRKTPSRWTMALRENDNDHEAIVTPDLYAVSLRRKAMSDAQS
jgi:hypothetical protein